MVIELSEQMLWTVAILLGVGVALLLAAGIRFLRHSTRSSSSDRQEVSRRWQRIEQLATSTDESSLRHAVIEADSVFDFAMRIQFFFGKDFGERLKTAQARYPKLRAIWQAHRLRNELVHELGTSLRRGQAARAVRIYREGLKELGLL